MTAFSWDRRIQRAEQLAKVHQSSADLLRFYVHVAQFQKYIYERPDPVCSSSLAAAFVAPHFLPFLHLIQRTGPPVAAELARELEREKTAFEDVVAVAWDGENELEDAPPGAVFFARALLQPCLERIARKPAIQDFPGVPAHLHSARCPCCGGKPGVVILRTSGEGAKRSLECSWCSTEWEFRRVVCPGCGEERNDRLPVYVASEFDYVRVEACDTCRIYVKAIDLTKNGLAAPCVDEIAAVSLDCWAQENGYARLSANAVGI